MIEMKIVTDIGALLVASWNWLSLSIVALFVTRPMATFLCPKCGARVETNMKIEACPLCNSELEKQ
jgi:rubrerythrin